MWLETSLNWFHVNFEWQEKSPNFCTMKSKDDEVIWILDEFPWQVSIRSLGTHFCGGAIINQNQVLTTASCVSDARPIFDAVMIN